MLPIEPSTPNPHLPFLSLTSNVIRAATNQSPTETASALNAYGIEIRALRILLRKNGFYSKTHCTGLFSVTYLLGSVNFNDLIFIYLTSQQVRQVLEYTNSKVCPAMSCTGVKC